MSEIKITPLERKHIMEALNEHLDTINEKKRAHEGIDEEECEDLHTQSWITKFTIAKIESLGNGKLFMRNEE